MVSTPQETGTRATLVIRHGHPGAEQIMPPPERPPERSHRRARTGVPAHSRGTIATDRRGGELLADMFWLYLKTKGFHWHMTGRHFRDYHLLLDEQAEQTFAMTDEIAEK